VQLWERWMRAWSGCMSRQNEANSCSRHGVNTWVINVQHDLVVVWLGADYVDKCEVLCLSPRRDVERLCLSCCHTLCGGAELMLEVSTLDLVFVTAASFRVYGMPTSFEMFKIRWLSCFLPAPDLEGLWWWRCRCLKATSPSMVSGHCLALMVG